MKNGNLYKIAAFMLALVFISAVGFAQEETKKEKKEKNYKIKMNIDGKNTVIDTIIIMNADSDVDMDAIMKEIEVQMEVSSEHMKEIHVELKAEMDEMHDMILIELKEVNEEVEKALETLQIELENLEIEAEVREKLNEALKTLEEADLRNVAHVEKIIMTDHKPMFVSEDGLVEVIVEGEGDTEAKVFWIEKDGEHGEHGDHEVNVWIDEDGNVSEGGEHEVNVWVDDNGEKKVIIKKSGTVKGENLVFYGDDTDVKHPKMVIIEKSERDGHMNMDMVMVQSASDEDFEKAIAAGLPVKEEQRFEDIDLNISVDGDQDPVIGFKTKESGKMKVTYYDEDFGKLKSMKLKENEGMHTFPMDQDELKEMKVKYILIEQNGKSDLMKL